MDTNVVIDYPNLDYFNINNLEDYNYSDYNIINKQFELLQKYNLDGFSVYYYWFSKNSITNQNKIMYSVIKKLLNNNYNTKIFYIWANQDWSNEKSLSHKKCNIENDYYIENLDKIIQELIIDFKHNNYLKIDNKPVFYILHPWEIKDEKIKYIKEKLNSECIKNNFDGINIRLNNMNIDMDKVRNKEDYFYMHPNYKKNNCTTYDSENKCALLDYRAYIDKNIKLDSNVQCLFFDFDNKVRLSYPDRLKYRTKVINNDKKTQIQYIKKIKEFYDSKPYSEDNILLINAWNEWGENMTIETSECNDNYYLELIQNSMGKSKKTNISKKKSISIIYFIWINIKKNYETIILGQLEDLINSGILEISNLYIEVCCEDVNLHIKIRNFIQQKLINYKYNINFYDKNKYEYYGISKMYELALKNPELIYLYIHSKGMTDFYDNKNCRHKYEKYLTYNTLNNYNNVINLFSNNNNITHTGYFPSNIDNFIWLNFYYAKGIYINTCEKPIVSQNRYYYETWSGTGKNPYAYCLYENNFKKYTINEVGDILNKIS